MLPITLNQIILSKELSHLKSYYYINKTKKNITDKIAITFKKWKSFTKDEFVLVLIILKNIHIIRLVICGAICHNLIRLLDKFKVLFDYTYNICFSFSLKKGAL